MSAPKPLTIPEEHLPLIFQLYQQQLQQGLIQPIFQCNTQGGVANNLEAFNQPVSQINTQSNGATSNQIGYAQGFNQLNPQFITQDTGATTTNNSNMTQQSNRNAPVLHGYNQQGFQNHGAGQVSNILTTEVQNQPITQPIRNSPNYPGPTPLNFIETHQQAHGVVHFQSSQEQQGHGQNIHQLQPQIPSTTPASQSENPPSYSSACGKIAETPRPSKIINSNSSSSQPTPSTSTAGSSSTIGFLPNNMLDAQRPFIGETLALQILKFMLVHFNFGLPKKAFIGLLKGSALIKDVKDFTRVKKKIIKSVFMDNWPGIVMLAFALIHSKRESSINITNAYFLDLIRKTSRFMSENRISKIDNLVRLFISLKLQKKTMLCPCDGKLVEDYISKLFDDIGSDSVLDNALMMTTTHDLFDRCDFLDKNTITEIVFAEVTSFVPQLLELAFNFRTMKNGIFIIRQLT